VSAVTQNQPVKAESKPATLKRFIHISFLDASKGLFNFFLRLRQRRLAC
jgi:hypothetical protein